MNWWRGVLPPANCTRPPGGKGFVSLAEIAVRRVLDGTTTIDEISRVVDLTDRLN